MTPKKPPKKIIETKKKAVVKKKAPRQSSLDKTRGKSGQTSPAKSAKTIKPAKKVKKDVYFEAVGRRKCSTSRVRIFENSGEKGAVTVNDKELAVYFPLKELQKIVVSPFEKTSQTKKFFTSVHVNGGGIKSQSEAIRLGVSRALLKYDIGLRPVLKAEKFLKRDARVKERRKFGLKKARKAPQWSKR